MYKKIFLPFFASLFSMTLLAQSNIKQGIDKAVTDSKAKENAAKADVWVQDKKVIADTTAIQPAQKTATTGNKKKKKCCSKKRQ